MHCDRLYVQLSAPRRATVLDHRGVTQADALGEVPVKTHHQLARLAVSWGLELVS